MKLKFAARGRIAEFGEEKGKLTGRCFAVDKSGESIELPLTQSGGHRYASNYWRGLSRN